MLNVFSCIMRHFFFSFISRLWGLFRQEGHVSRQQDSPVSRRPHTGGASQGRGGYEAGNRRETCVFRKPATAWAAVRMEQETSDFQLATRVLFGLAGLLFSRILSNCTSTGWCCSFLFASFHEALTVFRGWILLGTVLTVLCCSKQNPGVHRSFFSSVPGDWLHFVVVYFYVPIFFFQTFTVHVSFVFTINPVPGSCFFWQFFIPVHKKLWSSIAFNLQKNLELDNTLVFRKRKNK